MLLALIATLATATAHASPPPEHRADPTLTTYVQRAGPFTVGSYGMFEDAVTVTPPQVPGAIVAMDARLVDARGNVIPQHVAMLHHLVFTNGGPDNRRGDRACPFNATRERFYGTSEELRPAHAPARLRLSDQPGRPLARAADGDAPPRRRAQSSSSSTA